ncbi:hypothetical protein GCM10009548_44020 [Streptomyces malaysiensis subsp. malaysiensis]
MYATGAIPIGVPGWPEFAFWTASMHSPRMVFTDSVSRSVMATPPSVRSMNVCAYALRRRAWRRGPEPARGRVMRPVRFGRDRLARHAGWAFNRMWAISLAHSHQPRLARIHPQLR